jgi:hypothetical protein
VSTSTRPASTRSIKRLRQWLETPEFGDSFVSGKTEGVWDIEKGFNDFIVPRNGWEIADTLTIQLIAFLTYLESLIKMNRQPKDKLHTLLGPTKVKLRKVIVTTVASLFPVLPIIILFFVNQLLIRLVLVLVFTVSFALVLVFGLGIESGKTLAVTTA